MSKSVHVTPALGSHFGRKRATIGRAAQRDDPLKEVSRRRKADFEESKIGSIAWRLSGCKLRFNEDAIAAWAAQPRTTRRGQPWYSPLAILTALTLRTVFRLAYRQTEGLIGSIIGLLGLTLRVPDHTTLSRRAATLAVPRPAAADGDARPIHLLVDSTGLKLCGAGAWLVKKHGTKRRRAWRKLHLGMDAEPVRSSLRR